MNDYYIDYAATKGAKELEKKTYSREDCIWISGSGTIFFVGYTGNWLVWSYHIQTSVADIDKCFESVIKLIKKYAKEERRFLLDCPSSSDYYFENNGYIKKKISIDNISAEEIKAFYKDCLSNRKFPSLAEQSETKKANDDYLKYFGKVK